MNLYESFAFLLQLPPPANNPAAMPGAQPSAPPPPGMNVNPSGGSAYPPQPYSGQMQQTTTTHVVKQHKRKHSSDGES